MADMGKRLSTREICLGYPQSFVYFLALRDVADGCIIALAKHGTRRALFDAIGKRIGIARSGTGAAVLHCGGIAPGRDECSPMASLGPAPQSAESLLIEDAT